MLLCHLRYNYLPIPIKSVSQVACRTSAAGGAYRAQPSYRPRSKIIPTTSSANPSPVTARFVHTLVATLPLDS